MNNIYITILISVVIIILHGCFEADTYNYKEITNQQVILDKKHIAKSYSDNIEYYRKYCCYGNRRDSSKFSKHPYSQGDPSNFFVPYGSRYDLKIDNYVNSPLPTETQVTPHVVNIVYSPDSLKCVALVCVESHFDDIPPLEKEPLEYREFDGRIILGIRDSMNYNFKIYPYNNYSAIGFESCRYALEGIRHILFKELKGYIIGENDARCKGEKYLHNLDEPEFFETAPDFQKNKSEKFKDYYNCQLYCKYWKDIYPYQYYSNQPDSIKKKWDEGIDDWVEPEY